MAVLKVKKVHLIAHDSIKEDLLKAIQKKGLIHIIDLKEDLSLFESGSQVKSFEPDHSNVDLTLSKVNFTLDFLSNFEKKKTGMMASLSKELVEIGFAEFERIMDDVDLAGLYDKAHRLSEELSAIDAEVGKLKSLKSELAPWAGLDLDLGTLGETRDTIVSIGTVPVSSLDKLNSDLAEKITEATIEVIDHTSQVYYVFLVYLKQKGLEVAQILGNYGFQEVVFAETSGTATETIASVEDKLTKLAADRDLLGDRAKLMLSSKDSLLVLKTYLSSVRDRSEVQSNFARTEKVFIFEGWVLAERVDELSEIVFSLTKDADLTFEDPGEDDEPPVVLRNKKFIAPFEVVTKLYGNPKYGEIDPTPFLAPFFIIFFGMAMGDVAYGIILTAACLLLRKKLKVSEKVKSFLTLFAYGGVTTTIAGVLTGSYFTLDAEVLPAFLRQFIILDPLAEPITLLIYCLVFGVIHVFFGILIEMADAIKNKADIDTIMSEPSKIVLLSGLIILIAQLLSTGKSLPEPLLQTGKWLSIVGAVALVWFTGAGARNIFTRIGGGLFNLYGMSAFIGDIISYSRLMALGLATFLIGWGFNTIGGIARDLIPGFGIVVMVIIFIIGHVFNLLINLIGSFVHPARLQYVEFFSKFFEGGGEDFNGFSIKTKEVVLKD